MRVGISDYCVYTMQYVNATYELLTNGFDSFSSTIISESYAPLIKMYLGYINTYFDKVPTEYQFFLDGNIQGLITSGDDELFLLGYEIIKTKQR